MHSRDSGHFNGSASPDCRSHVHSRSFLRLLHRLQIPVASGALMKEPRLHHYIPRFYLSGFADPGALRREKKEIIWVYEREKQVRRSAPAKEARQRDFYAFVKNDSRNVEVETWLGKVEEQVAPIIASLAKDKRRITDAEKEGLALFVGTMQMRTPTGRYLSEMRIDPFVTNVMKEAAADPAKFRSFVEENYQLPAEDVGFDLEEVRRDILAGRGEEIAERDDVKLASIIEVGKRVAQVLFDMNWQTIYSENQELFLTSDDPVISHVTNKETGREHFRMGVDSLGANVWFPLCCNLCLRINKDCESGYGRWVNAGIRMVNKMEIMCADRWVFSPERSDKIKDLFDRQGGKLSIKTVDLRFEGQRY